MKKILIIVGGGTKHLAPFEEAAHNLGIDLTAASFSDFEYLGEEKNVNATVKGLDIEQFEVVYIRLVGERKEETALLVSFCKEKEIRVVDKTFLDERFSFIPIPKSIEARVLLEAGISFPKTYFGCLEKIKDKAPNIFGFPFVIKGTTGKQGRAVWSPRNKKELEKLSEELKEMERIKKVKFIAQEFLKASQRSRIFVIGDKAVAAITRPTRWRRRFIEKVEGSYPEGRREALKPVPENEASLAVSAAKALSLEIAGADILKEDSTGKLYVIEVNSAPRWASIKEDTGIDIEAEIVKYLVSL